MILIGSKFSKSRSRVFGFVVHLKKCNFYIENYNKNFVTYEFWGYGDS